MQPIRNYASAQAFGTRRKIPKGGYICRILAAHEVELKGKTGAFKKLEISFDITEGEYRGFFKQDYDTQDPNKRKWKGVLRIGVPTGDGTESDNVKLSILKGCIEAVEKSNSGYKWNWDEKTLAGKSTGVIFRNEEWEFEGRTGWKAQPYIFVPVADIKGNTFVVPEDKPLSVNNSAQPYPPYPPYPADPYGAPPDMPMNPEEFEPIGGDVPFPWDI